MSQLRNRPNTPTNRGRSRFLTLWVFASIALSIVFLFWAATLARPIADDYCAAQIVSDQGLLGHISYGWQRTGGAAFQYLFYAFFPGAIMNALPWSLAGVVMVLTPALCLGLIVWIVGRRLKLLSQATHYSSLWVVGIVSVGWFAIWTVNGLISTIVRAPVGSSSIDNARASWFGLTTFFLVDANQLMTILLLACWGIILLSPGKPLWRLPFSLIVGIATGLAGPQFTAMFIASALTVSIVLYLRRDKSVSTSWRLRDVAITVGASAASFLFSTQAPGFIYRKTASSSGFSVLGALESVASNLYLWLIRLISPGMLVALAIGICVGLIANSSLRIRSVQFPALMLAVSFVSAFATGLCHIFIYSAYWHAIPWTIPMYLAVIFFGLVLGKKWKLLAGRPFIQHRESGNKETLLFGLNFQTLNQLPIRISGWQTLLILVTTALLITTSVAQAVHARGRLAEWNAGPAPQAGGVTDIEGNTHFTSCWSNWYKSRDSARALE